MYTTPRDAGARGRAGRGLPAEGRGDRRPVALPLYPTATGSSAAPGEGRQARV